MLSSILRSERAVRVNIAIIRAFIRLRQTISGHKELLHHLDAMQRKLAEPTAILRLFFTPYAD